MNINEAKALRQYRDEVGVDNDSLHALEVDYELLMNVAYIAEKKGWAHAVAIIEEMMARIEARAEELRPERGQHPDAADLESTPGVWLCTHCGYTGGWDTWEKRIKQQRGED